MIRLLSYKAEKNDFQLTTFRDEDNLPQYAILSHTWEDGQEVIYDELVAGTGKEKTGYVKLRFCGERALRDGLQHFWVDTCCIDKRDPTELGAAINSMFRWYQQAYKCYVYLSDVHVPTEVADVQTFRSTWEGAFRRSRWFTRGWTLQELLAPGTVEFFSKEGKMLGSKVSLEQEIHDITNIPIRALRKHSLRDFSVDERMRWVDGRRTTVKEDRVYCLLGIFEVFLPLIYGEGEQHAFGRLRREITENEGSRGGSGTAKAPIKPVSSLLPFPQNSSFVGRESHLQALEQWLYQPHAHRRMTVYGLGGCGKTALVLEFAYRVLAKHSGYLVFWVPAINRESFESTYREMGKLLNLPGITNDNADVKKLVKEGLSSGSFGDWLIIVDNADDPSVLFSSLNDEPQSKRLIDYLPQNDRGSVVFTTRGRKSAVSLTQSNVLELEDMTNAKTEAKQLIASRISNKDLIDDDNATTELLELLAYLPLAIMQSTAFINVNDIPVSEYVLLLRDADTEAELFSRHFEDPNRYNELESTIAKTWHISFNQILKRDRLAADYLSFMACIDRVNIPLSLLPAGDSRLRQIEAIGTLKGYAFITERREGLQQSREERFFDVHRLVHMTSALWLKEQNVFVNWIKKSFSRLNNLLPKYEFSERDMRIKYLSHAIYLAADLRNGLKDTARATLLRGIAICHRELGQYSEALILCQKVFLMRNKMFGREHPATLESMNDLGGFYRDQGRWKEAEELIVQVLEMRKRVLGKEHWAVVSSMSLLALIYLEQGLLERAEELNSQVIEIKKRVLSNENDSLQRNMFNQARIYLRQGRLKEAENLTIQIIKMQKRDLGNGHLKVVSSMFSLGLIYQSQGRLKEAEELIIQTLEVKKRILGDDHPDVLTSMSNLAILCMDQGRLKEAEELMLQVIEVQTRVLGIEHPDTLYSKVNLAQTYRAAGNYESAITLTRSIILARERNHSLYQETLSQLESLESWLEGQCETANG